MVRTADLKYGISGLKNHLQYFLHSKELGTTGGKLIILYHGIDYRNSTRYNTRFISIRKFEQEIVLLKKHFKVVDLETLLHSPLRTDALEVAITFDDGYENNYTMARPILEKYQVPATFFISRPQGCGYDILWADLIDMGVNEAPDEVMIGGVDFHKIQGQHRNSEGLDLKTLCARGSRTFLDEVYRTFLPYTGFMQKPEMAPYWKLLSEDQIRDLSNHDLFKIGAHGLMHSSIHLLSLEEAGRELSGSKSILEEIIQKPVNYFAYPHGVANEDSVLLAAGLGYEAQFLANPSNLEHMENVYNRMGINPFISARGQTYCFHHRHY
ncbi:polysaccharide deacetylase family protein [Marinoscillum sp.]|uniref:polysaccharide deacetylase family protein n=1 Tax=Marinoscillum sp. TaxID=2024838 RepID=UPI003BACB2FC